MTDDGEDWKILLVKLDTEEDLDIPQIQYLVESVVNTVNEAGDITGIWTVGLFISHWGSDLIATILVVVSDADRFDDHEESDTAIEAMFKKSISLCGYSDIMTVLDDAERNGLHRE